MRSTTLPLITVALLSGIGPSATAAPKESDAYHIVFARRPVRAGERLELKLVPPAPRGVRVNWSVASGTSGKGLQERGLYRAPYVIAPGTFPVRISAGFSTPDFRASAAAEIELQPGSVAGAADCLGPGQSFSTVIGDIEPSYIYVDELPELIHRVDPEYPRSAWARGVEETIPVNVLVCRSGQVLDAYALSSYRGGPGQPIGDELIERDPKLVEAALAAARQFVFKPAMGGGQPLAVWVHVPVRFRR